MQSCNKNRELNTTSTPFLAQTSPLYDGRNTHSYRPTLCQQRNIEQAISGKKVVDSHYPNSVQSNESITHKIYLLIVLILALALIELQIKDWKMTR
ncbi:MAG: hypothetical protein DID89_2727545992 [Candidatus Nitrotoga sp. CP45]|nr:MAG: hypothetical protein DID89_2727545992 [Candidatus Nitrotoga sp. CP45]